MPQTAPPAKPAPASATDRNGRRRDQLDLGRAMDVDELNQQVGDPVILQSAFELDKLFFQVGHAYAGPFTGRSRLAAWQTALKKNASAIFDPRLLATATRPSQ